jgi:hypothetical protein
VRQPKSAASIDVQQFSEFAKRNRMFGPRNQLKNRQSAIEALDEWNLRAFLGCHILAFSCGVLHQWV